MGDHHCIVCTDFASSNIPEMKRHVAIVHGKGTFSTLRCQICQEKFYDFEHFQEHVREMPACFTGSFKITPEQLEPHVENAFLSLVSQMMQPIKIQPTRLPKLTCQASMMSMNQKPGQSVAAAYPGEITPKIVSVSSLAHSRSIERTRMNSRREVAGDMTMERKAVARFNNIDSKSKGNSSKLATASRAFGNSSGKAISQSMTSNGGSTDQVGKDTRPKLTYDEFLCDCESIIAKRQHKGRITCILCQGSLAVAYGPGGEYINKRNAIAHVRRHLGVFAFHCNLCEYKSMTQIQSHLGVHHPKASLNQITDKTIYYIEELKELFNRCFDHDVRLDVGLKRGRRIVEADQRKVERNTNESMETIRTGVSATSRGSNTRKKTKISVPVPTRQTNRNQESSTLGNRSVPVSTRQKATRKKIARELFLNQRRAHLEKLKKSVRGGRLHCQLCDQSIMVAVRSSDTALNMISAYRHASTHLSLKLFKCSNCSYVASVDTTMNSHTAKCQKGSQRSFIDYSSKYSQEIFKNLLACYKMDPVDGQSQSTAIELKVDQQPLEETKDISKPVDIPPTTTKQFSCDKCSYKSCFEKLFKMHLELMH